MRGFITFVFLGLILGALSLEANPIRDMINQKTRLAKLGVDGKEVNPVLQAHGSGITDGQEKLVTGYIDQAEQIYGNDIYSNALFIQQKVEDNLSGRWVVQVFGGDPSWGRATHIKNDQWILFFGYGQYSWDYIIWAPDC